MRTSPRRSRCSARSVHTRSSGRADVGAGSANACQVMRTVRDINGDQCSYSTYVDVSTLFFLAVLASICYCVYLVDLFVRFKRSFGLKPNSLSRSVFREDPRSLPTHKEVAVTALVPEVPIDRLSI